MSLVNQLAQFLCRLGMHDYEYLTSRLDINKRDGITMIYQCNNCKELKEIFVKDMPNWISEVKKPEDFIG